VSPSLHDEEVDWFRRDGVLLGVFSNSIPDVLLSGRLHVSPGKSVLRFRHGTEFHLRSLHRIGVYNITLYYHVVPVLPYLFLGAEDGVSKRKQLERRKPATNRTRARSESDQNAGRCSCWVLVLLASYYGYRPNRHEQWSTNASQTGLLLLRFVNLHVVSHKPSVVRPHEPLVPGGI